MESFESCIRNTLCRTIEDTALHADSYAFNPGHDFTRNRKLPLAALMKTIVIMEGNSLNKELFDIHNHGAGSKAFITKSAFVQQRGKLKHEAFRDAFYIFNRKTCINDTNRYDGYKLFAIDGTDTNIALNENSDTYYSEKCNSISGKGYNQFHVNTLYDITNSVYIDAVIQPGPKKNEVEAARQMVRGLEESNPYITIMDRGFCSLDLLATINEDPNAEFIVRTRSNFIEEVRDLPEAPCDFDCTFRIVTTQTKQDKEDIRKGIAKWLPGPSSKGKDNKIITWLHGNNYMMSLRIVRFQLDTGEWETLITSLDRKNFPPEKLKELYHMRWGIETSFRALKYAIGMTSFHARKEESVKQEIFARLLAYNFCSRITNSVIIEQDESRKWIYKVNFTQAIHICLHYLKHMAEMDVRDLIRKYIEPVRPGRSDERNIKAKGFVFFNYRVA